MDELVAVLRAVRRRVAVVMRRLRGGSFAPAEGTSISDRGDYVSLCAAAARDDRIYRRFRSHPDYRNILEHVTESQGRRYLELLLEDDQVAAALPRLAAGDAVGGPTQMALGERGRVSPTTLRYIKVLTDLRRLFGPLDDLEVAEIGVGYGGQARILTSFHRIPRYHLFDLPPVLDLARRFLADFPDATSDFAFLDGREVPAARSDLVVSNYALSELRREVQVQYVERVIAAAPRGYVTYNHISPPEFRTLTAAEFAALIPGAEFLPEDPRTHPDNVIVVWGHLTPGTGR